MQPLSDLHRLGGVEVTAYMLKAGLYIILLDTKREVIGTMV